MGVGIYSRNMLPELHTCWQPTPAAHDTQVGIPAAQECAIKPVIAVLPLFVRGWCMGVNVRIEHVSVLFAELYIFLHTAHMASSHYIMR